MRIAIDARLVSYIGGGTSQYTLRLVRALAGMARDHDIVVLESRKAADRADWPDSVRRMRLLTPPHHRLEQVALPLELLRARADVLHSPDFIPPFRRGCRSVVTVHDLAFLRFPSLLTSESARYYGQVAKAVRSADQVIAVSHATKGDLLALLAANPEKVTVVHEAADPNCRPLEPSEVARHRRRLELPERFFLFVGTLEPRKNLPTLLRAFARISEKRGHARGVDMPSGTSTVHGVPLVVAGGRGWLYEEVFRTRDELGLGENVRFVGHVPAGELLYYYNCATCLLMPSLYEGFGLPVLEAMACGTPALISNVSSLPGIAGEAAL
ncbi:MAG: glycosyltransferase family 4 protein, partial [Actinobacteria bacterium]|nr:glycosyltransferase family 4 protein [Actinomycetota bacterium]